MLPESVRLGKLLVREKAKNQAKARSEALGLDDDNFPGARSHDKIRIVVDNAIAVLLMRGRYRTGGQNVPGSRKGTINRNAPGD